MNDTNKNLENIDFISEKLLKIIENQIVNNSDTGLNARVKGFFTMPKEA